MNAIQELVKRLRFTLVCIALSSIFTYSGSKRIVELIHNYYMPDVQWAVYSITEAVTTHVYISILLGVVFSSPIWLYEMYAFLNPALYKNERKVLQKMIIPSVVLFLLGILFSLYIFLPTTIVFLQNESIGYSQVFGLWNMLFFIGTTTILMGATFQIPLVMYTLNTLGIIQRKVYAQSRKVVILLSFIVAGIVTADPTPVSQIMLSLPIIGLYEVGIRVSK